MHAEKGNGLKRIFLHIGQPKTATTTIQNFLSINRAELIKHGWLYPNAGRQYAAHHLLGNFFRAAPIHWIGRADPAQVMAELKHEIDESNCDNIILSTESLYFAENPDQFAAYLKDFDVSVVVFLRRQDEWLESAYQENRKNGENRLDPERYLTAHQPSLDYAGRLDFWASAFGKNKILVHTFERTSARLPVEQVFMENIGAPFPPGLIRAPLLNERLNRDCIAFLTQFEAAPRVDMKHQVIKDILIKYSVKHPDTPALKNFYTPQRRRQIVEAHAEANAYVAREYLGRADGRLFNNPLPKDSDPWQPYPGLRAPVAVSIAEFLAGEMYQLIVRK